MAWEIFRRLVAVAAFAPALAVAQPAPNSPPPRDFYAWFDGGYRNISLPAFALGSHTFDVNTFGDLGPVQTFRPRIDAAAFQSGIGFSIPDWVLPALFGSNVRIGLTGSYITGDGRQSAPANSNAPMLVWLDGTIFFGCGCNYVSRLTTNYSAFRLGLDVTSDIRAGALTFSPSIEVLGGSTRVRQSLTQTDDVDVYTSGTRLSWDDVGVKFGLGVAAPVTPAFEIGVTGTVAVLHRDVRLTGSDFVGGLGGINFGTSIDRSARTVAVIPGGQMQLLFSPFPQTRLRLYGGLEWDSRVPGIVAPGFTAEQVFAGFQGNPASIGFSGQTTYFAGGGFTQSFAAR